MINGRYIDACVSCPLACSVNARWSPYKVPDRQIHVAVLHRGVDLIHADLPRGQCLRIQLNPYRIFLRAVNLNLRDAFHHRNPLAHQRFGVAIDGVRRQRLRTHRDVKDGLVGGVHLVVGRRRRHVRRQLR